MIIDVHLPACSTPHTAREVLFKARGKIRDFRAFAQLLEGGVFDRDHAYWRAPANLDKVLPILMRLREAKMELLGTPEFRGWLAEERARHVLEKEAAEGRAEEARARLKARGLELYPFQKVGATWIALRTGALLGSSAGLGKTIQILTALPDKAPVLVVAPAVAKGVWQNELGKWRPGEWRATVLDGRGTFRWPQAGELLIANAEILPAPECKGLVTWRYAENPRYAICPECFELCDPHMRARFEPMRFMTRPIACARPVAYPDPAPGTVLVLDEAHAYRRRKTSRSRIVATLAALVRQHGGKTWGATGTPLLNQPAELYNLLEILGCARETFGSWKQFTTLFAGKKDIWGTWRWGTPSPEVIPRLQRVMLRHEKAQVLPELPSRTVQDIQVPLDRATRLECSATLAMLEEQGVSFDDLLELALASKENRVLVETVARTRKALAMAKVPFLLKLVASYEAQEEPLLVFSAHKDPILALGKRKGWAAITGAVNAEERGDIEAEFQAGRLRGIGATIQAGGVALTLTRACNLIFVDRLWTPSLNEQAEDRAVRLGQKRGVLIMNLVGDHNLDVHLSAVCQKKTRLIAQTIGAAAVTG